MFNKILVAVDPSFDAGHDRILAMARKLATDSLAEISALSVLEPAAPYPFGAPDAEARAEAAEHAMAALRHHIGEGSEIRTFIRHGRAAHEILSHAEEHGSDCILVASHQPGFSDYLLGSTAARVVRHARCTVIVVR